MLGFVFPGQGSQQIGMLAGLAVEHRIVQDLFAEASEVLGYDLWKLVQEGPEPELNLTQKTQPAMLAAGYATWKVWQESGGSTPSIVAGHSLGEYTALTCADAMEFKDAVALVADRGRFMQSAVADGAGAMAAILGLTEEQINEACYAAAEGQVVACANLNSPGQIVIAGHKAAVERAVVACKDLGSKRAVLLAVSVPSHCELMRNASAALFDRLQQINIRTPKVPVIHNSDVVSHPNSAGIKNALVEQLFMPVRWVDVIKRMVEGGVAHIVECGPGKVLTGLCRRIDGNLACHAVYDSASLNVAINASREGA